MMRSDQYFAGFVDGEGCVSIGTNKSAYSGKRVHYLRLSVHQLDKRPLDLLRERFGGSVNLNRTHKPRPLWQWAVADNKALHALEALRDSLVVKREQAQLGIEFQRGKLARNNSRLPLLEVEVAERESYYLAMRDLKQVDYDEV